MYEFREQYLLSLNSMHVLVEISFQLWTTADWKQPGNSVLYH